MSDQLEFATSVVTSCRSCEELRSRGRSERDPVHCITCHRSWTGNEAQHCTACHRTFASISSADRHRWKRPKGEPNGECVDVESDPAWHEKRPGVWAFGRREGGWA